VNVARVRAATVPEGLRPQAHRHSIATVALGGTLGEKLAAAAAAGFDGIELFEPDLIAAPLKPQEVRRRLEDLGLTLELYQPMRDIEAVRPEQFRRNLRRVRSKLDLMLQLGAPILLMCSNATAGAVEDDDLAAEQLAAVADEAEARGLKVAYEALAWGTRVNDYAHAWSIVQRAGHPALGLCLDSFHILARGSSLDEITAIPPDKLFMLQLADAPRVRMDELQWSRHFRCFPGQGGFDLVSFTDRVLDAGYAGPLSLEIFNDVFRQADPYRTAVDGRRSLIWLEEGIRRPAAKAPSGGQAKATGPRPAPLPPEFRFAFLELYAPPAAAQHLERLLTGLGFGCTGRHRTKPVTIWEAGGARVVVNTAHRVATAPAQFLLTGVGLEVGDVSFIAHRAEALRVPQVPNHRHWDEADLPSVEAPDGTEILLGRPGGEDGYWLDDFDPSSAGSPFAARTRLTGIDHVALAQPLNVFHEAALFYRSLLRLEPLQAEELTSPHGLIRSQAFVGGTRGEVRIVLNVPALGDSGRAESDPGQHVAIQSSDIVETARSVTAQGLLMLPIPGNYYDDLMVRFDLDMGSLEKYRRYNILYDEDAEGHVFRHFYIASPRSRVLFEIVQRGPGYQGYGAGNAVTRMNAQERG
jgi:4-hydroxyphenylpyruvate dioxygenase